MQKCMRRRKADGSWICARCRLQGSKVETELHAAKKERDLAAEKAKEASLLLKEEKKKRLQLALKTKSHRDCAEEVGTGLSGVLTV